MSEAEKELRAFYDMLVEHGWIKSYQLEIIDGNVNLTFEPLTPIKFITLTADIGVGTDLNESAS